MNAGDWSDRARLMVEMLSLPEGPVAAAMRSVPRHRFVPRGLERQAYADTPLPIGPDSTISAPHMVALQLEWSELGPGQRVLELGCGSGYLLALAAQIVGPSGRVIGVEIEPEMAHRAREVLDGLGLATRVRVERGDAVFGDPAGGVFDRIIVSFALPLPFPQAWRRQLQEGGLIVAPVNRGLGTYLEAARKRESGWEVRRGPPCLFVERKHSAVTPTLSSSETGPEP